MSNEEIKNQVVGDKVRMNMWMSRKMFEFLQYVSSRDGRSMSDIIRESLRDYIAKDKNIIGENHADNSESKFLAE